MMISLNTRSVTSATATEFHISVVPTEAAPPQEQAERLFTAVREELVSERAHILLERVITTQETAKIVSSARSEAYGDVDDGVAPSIVCGKEGLCGPVAGVQVHAVRAQVRPDVIKLDGKPLGRILRTPNCAYLTLSNVSALQSADATGQAWAMMEKAESALKQFDADFQSVARTWMWLGDILRWYDEFNSTRNRFFTERGLIGQGPNQSMPASTGIGLRPAGGGECAMDLAAVLHSRDPIQFLPAIGKQQCALEYGSAFSRACRAVTPAGETVFVSGTASIDASGATTNIGDAAGQIDATIENVRAVLRDMNVTDDDVVQVIAYCKTTEVESIFNEGFKGRLAWPWLTAVCDICRPDLLFEIEATAVPNATV